MVYSFKVSENMYQFSNSNFWEIETKIIKEKGFKQRKNRKVCVSTGQKGPEQYKNCDKILV